MKIVTWNVNSIRARLPHVTAWLTTHQPDVVLLQEIKCLEADFPKELFEDLGYNIAIHGQKTFNGVAILAKFPIEDVQKSLPCFTEDEQARYIEGVVKDVRVASVYVPNGEAPGTEKYAYKLTFLERLKEHLTQILRYDEKFVLGGDFNIAPQDDDVHDPVAWHEQILCTIKERKAFWSLLYLGLTDAIRVKYKGKGPYSWWDYRNLSWTNNEGLRIDHLLLSPQSVDHMEDVGIDPTPRAGEKASDHVPVWCTLQEVSSSSSNEGCHPNGKDKT